MAYKRDHSFLVPKDSGIKYGALTDEELKKLSPGLTEAEKSCPHARYYYEMPAPLPKEYEQAIAAGPMDARKAFDMEMYGKHMNNTGYCEVENGYCVLPNGVTYAAVLLRQEGRTNEMIDFYNQFFAPEESLFYKIWYPGSHYLHYEDGALEDFGFGRIHMRFVGGVEPKDLGIDPTEIEKNDPNCIFIGGTSAIGYNLDRNFKKLERNCIVFYHRLTDYGREVRVRLWYGIGVEDGDYYLTVPPAEEALDIAKKTMIHVMQEYTNDQYLEMKFWRDRWMPDHGENQALYF